MPIQNSMKMRRKPQSASDLSQTSEEDFGSRHLRAGRQVLRVACIANDCVGGDPAQQKRRGGQTGRADHDVWRRGESLEIGRDLDLNSISINPEASTTPASRFQLRGEPF